MNIEAQNWVGWCMVSLLSVATFAASTDDLSLLIAAKNQDLGAVSALLNEHRSVDTTQGDGSTALHWAAHWDDLKMAGLLIRSGAHVNMANDLGVTPLYLACVNGSAAMVELLLAGGANPNVVAVTGVSPLMQAARSGNVEAVEALLTHGAKTDVIDSAAGQNALMWAVAERHPDVVRVLVRHGVDVRTRSRITSVFVNINGGGKGEDAHGPAKMMPTGGSTAMLFAAREGCMECAEALLAGGADVNDTTPDGNSALVLASHSGKGAFASYLLGKGADPNSSGAGYTALHAAALRGDLDLVKVLLAHGANPDVPLANGTPMRRAGPDYSLPESLVGATALLLAARYGDVDMMRALSGSGANLKLKAKDGTTLLMAAASADYRSGGIIAAVKLDEGHSHATEAVRLILDLDKTCEVNAADQAGNTAMHLAAARGYDTVVQLLSDHGARLDLKNKRGQTPLGITPRRFKNTADILHKLGAIE